MTRLSAAQRDLLRTMHPKGVWWPGERTVTANALERRGLLRRVHVDTDNDLKYFFVMTEDGIKEREVQP